jgi:hypothetical protein
LLPFWPLQSFLALELELELELLRLELLGLIASIALKYHSLKPY